MYKNIIKGFASKKIMGIGEVQKYWSDYSQQYNTFDLGPQTFYYSFLNLTQIWKASNILEVGCGTGKVLPLAVSLKNPDAKYLASDLSPQMIELTKLNLQKNFDKYNSKFTYENWLKQQNISFKVANAEQKILSSEESKFDRIICNCVLMLTQNPEKMLSNLYDSAAPGCLMGVSVWGNKDYNNFIMSIRSSIVQAGVQIPQQRSNFHLYKKIEKLAEKCQWEIVLNWEQNALFPVMQFSREQHYGLFYHQIQKLPLQQQPKVKEILEEKFKKQLQMKRGLNFSCQLLVLRKK